MKAVELTGYEGLKSLNVVDVDTPKPGPGEVLIQVKAAGINFAELELAHGKYRVPKNAPFIMGFEAAGVVVETGPKVTNFKPGAKVASIVSSGGYAEYATADAGAAIPIPEGISFAEASSITIQGLSAYMLLKYAAKPKSHETVLVQSAAGGVGLYLVQLAKLMGVKTVIGLVGSAEKLHFVKRLGVEHVFDYSDAKWIDRLKEATGGAGIDVVLEAASGDLGEKCFGLAAPFGRIVMFGAKNVHDTLTPEKIQQLIYNNQSLIGFNFPSMRPEQIAESVPELLGMIVSGKVKLFAPHSFPLEDVKKAFAAISNRETIGKVVLTP
jgi:NADPH2:quinone reductase